jgi:hypothetical protein
MGVHCTATQHPLSAKVVTNFAGKRRLLGWLVHLWAKAMEFYYFFISKECSTTIFVVKEQVNKAEKCLMSN